MDNDNLDLRVEIEGIKKDLENASSINTRLDTAIEKLTDVSTCIKSMLAVHEVKIERQEKTDEIIFEKIKDRADEIDSVYRELQREINQVERRLLIEIKALRNDIGSRVIHRRIKQKQEPIFIGLRTICSLNATTVVWAKIWPTSLSF